MANTNGRRKSALLSGAGDVPWTTPGYLMIIGGADRLDPAGLLGRLFLQLVDRVERNSAQRDIVLVTTATRHPEILTAEYRRIFTHLGFEHDHLHAPYIRSHDEAQEERIAQLLGSAAGIFITGGDQYRLSQILDRSLAEKSMLAAYNKGAIIAGTSAGATAMGRPMVVAGGGTGELRAGIVQMANGLGWAGDDIIIDTHFGSRGRFPRLASCVVEHPEALGVGIDENTCVLLDSEGHGTIAGTGVVYFLDASHLTLNTIHHTSPGAPISAGPLEVTVLAAGQAFDVRARRMLLEIGAVSRV